MAVLAKAGCSAGRAMGTRAARGVSSSPSAGRTLPADYEVLMLELGRPADRPVRPGREPRPPQGNRRRSAPRGKCFDHDSQEYGIFRRWIEVGTRDDSNT